MKEDVTDHLYNTDHPVLVKHAVRDDGKHTLIWSCFGCGAHGIDVDESED